MADPFCTKPGGAQVLGAIEFSAVFCDTMSGPLASPLAIGDNLGEANGFLLTIPFNVVLMLIS
jgi:hypothetical protein